MTPGNKQFDALLSKSFGLDESSPYNRKNNKIPTCRSPVIDFPGNLNLAHLQCELYGTQINPVKYTFVFHRVNPVK